MSKLTAEEFKIMDDMNDVNIEMAKRIDESAPRCHMTPMDMDDNELETWWECQHCGHTKLAWTNSYPY
jgi:hypothetical protein